MNTFWLVASGTLTGAVGPGISVLYATYGEVITERSGKINLGTEGCMLMGATFAFIIAAETGNPGAAILVGALAGGLLSLLHAFLVVSRRANQLATGIAVTLFGLGITSFAGRSYVSVSIGGLDPISIPLLSRIPVLGEALFQQDILTYIAYALGPLLWAALRFTRWGLSLRAVGESADVAYAAGRNPALVQYVAIFLGGLLAGLGGAHLSLALTHSWSEAMTRGRGFIAVGLVIFGMWNPLRAMLGALLFGGAIGLELQLQTIGAPVSPFVLAMLPYVITLGVLSIWSGAALRAMPEGLKAVFKKAA